MKNPLNDLYARLKEAGLGREFVRERLLPDWWDDSLASVPANRALAELTIAQLLGLRVADLRNPDAKLSLKPARDYRLKHPKGVTPLEVRPAVAIAERVADLVGQRAKELPAFSGTQSARFIRDEITKTGYVNLNSLVRFCWDHGIAVAHLDLKGLQARKFHGMALHPRRNPVIVLAYGIDSPPWLAFHLAHEMGHIMCAHLKPGGDSLVDANIEVKAGAGDEENEANLFAMEVLTGERNLSFSPEYGLTAHKLARAASAYGATHGIDPATCVLIYGKSTNRWPVAEKALGLMGELRGAQDTICKALTEHLDLQDLDEPVERFLSCLSIQLV
ncbi:MAG TPA: ImmA/IrrE family metallo-endopeptidase [Planctomycetota bacterium]|nr:ImmA/IrrE family metallo-endopeptidase [Planctomycetota bacterium]